MICMVLSKLVRRFICFYNFMHISEFIICAFSFGNNLFFLNFRKFNFIKTSPSSVLDAVCMCVCVDLDMFQMFQFTSRCRFVPFFFSYYFEKTCYHIRYVLMVGVKTFMDNILRHHRCQVVLVPSHTWIFYLAVRQRQQNQSMNRQAPNVVVLRR